MGKSDMDTLWRIRGATLIDPFRGVTARDEDLWVHRGRVVDADRVASRKAEVVEAQGLWLVPRLTDMHVHFRAPGMEWKEDLLSGCRAAAHGGFPVVATMPNTVPVVDEPYLVEWQTAQAQELGLCHIIPIGAVTRGSAGKELADLWRMSEKGARGFSDDGRPVADGRLMRTALSYSKTLDLPVIQHSEDPDLARGGVMHEGGVSHRLGLPGMPAQAESVMVWRDVQLAELTGGHLHVAHISTAAALEALAWAERRKLSVTAEATPHHLWLTDEAVAEWEYSPLTKVNPPLRPETMRRALIDAVVSGLVGVIASDHAPHHADEKALPYGQAPFGISGLETSIGTALTLLVHEGRMDPLDLFARMSSGPHAVMRLAFPGLVPGAAADLTLIDPNHSWQVDVKEFESKGKNTPMAGARLKGRAVATMVDGRWVMREGEVLAG